MGRFGSMGRLARFGALAALFAAATSCGTGAVAVDHRGDPGIPVPRADASSAYDAANGTIVMFGGVDRDGVLDETWTWDGDTWRRRHPAHSPPARESGLMAFDASDDRVILFGGLSCPPPSPNDAIGCDYSATANHLSDTWMWNGDDWSQARTAHSPTVPYFASTLDGLGSDPVRHQVLLLSFVTPVNSSLIAATWTFANGDWTELHPKHSPRNMAFAGPAFDAVSGRLLVEQSRGPHVDCFSGPCPPGPTHDATWAWDGSDWSDLGTDVGTPHGYGTLLEAGGRGVVMLMDGGLERWDGKRWGSVAPGPWVDRTIRTDWTAAFDAASGQLLVYGGRVFETNHLEGDTFGWNGSAWRKLMAAPPSPPATLYPCDPKTAVAGVGGYGGGPSISPTSVAIGIAFFEPHAGPCHLDVVVQFSLTGPDGRLVPIAGNPSHVELVADLTYDYGFEYATFTIANACGLPQGTIATFGGADVNAEIPVSGPYCPQPAGALSITAGTLHRPDEK
ncbi:MAG TPA: hypothetical protein VFB69_03120 [Candidatus Dormibacteraeota bacterium]|nr:hypothetical protein [Candidatus Dormibacteraeota bacterium]